MLDRDIENRILCSQMFMKMYSLSFFTFNMIVIVFCFWNLTIERLNEEERADRSTLYGKEKIRNENQTQKNNNYKPNRMNTNNRAKKSICRLCPILVFSHDKSRRSTFMALNLDPD